MKNRDRDGYYSLLGITPDATSEQVEEAYKSALKAAAEQPGTDFIRKAAETAKIQMNPKCWAAVLAL